jgi:dsRNA-specific ribonuclease|tara:strand:- start:526 stop:1542 length:1017 start_codon:yes stop_codon:yes gene_type:complete
MTEMLEKTINKDDDIIKEGGELIFNPFNELNKEITISEVQTILNNYGVVGTVNNIELYKRAFAHCSYTKRPALENQAENIIIVDRPSNCMPLKSKSNERLEFLGDGVLECITKYYLYRRFPKEDEGFMTEKKIALVKNEHIGKLAREMGLHKWYIISKHAEEKNIRTNTKKLGCLFEAFLGALFLDFNKIEIHDEDKWFDNIFVTGPGFQMSQIFVEKIFENHVDWTELISNDDNYKNQLQVLLQKEFKKTPDYMIISQDLEEGYTMGVYLCLGQHIYDQEHTMATPFTNFKTLKNISETVEQDKKVFIFFGKGTHKIKKKAEQIACEKALNSILNKS